MYDKVAEIISARKGCKKEDIDMDCKLSDLGISSLDIVEILMSIEYSTGIVVSYCNNLETVGNLVVAIEEKQIQ